MAAAPLLGGTAPAAAQFSCNPAQNLNAASVPFRYSVPSGGYYGYGGNVFVQGPLAGSLGGSAGVIRGGRTLPVCIFPVPCGAPLGISSRGRYPGGGLAAAATGVSVAAGPAGEGLLP
jgi:hypothetical protein